MSSENKVEFTKENISNINDIAESLQKKADRASVLAELRKASSQKTSE